MDTINNASQTYPTTALSALFAVQLFVNLGNVILVEKCSVNSVSLIGWPKILPPNALSSAPIPKSYPSPVKPFWDSTLILILNAPIPSVIRSSNLVILKSTKAIVWKLSVGILLTAKKYKMKMSNVPSHAVHLYVRLCIKFTQISATPKRCMKFWKVFSKTQ